MVDAWLRSSAAYATVITRSRYAEDALHSAIARGVKQYVLIGAGFDSYVLRRPPEARYIEIFEVDHPATQSFKRQRIVDCGIALRNSVHFLDADPASIGEPFLSGFDPNALADMLQSVGFELQEDLDDFQVVAKYDPLGMNGLRPSRHSRIARARVVGAVEQRPA